MYKNTYHAWITFLYVSYKRASSFTVLHALAVSSGRHWVYMNWKMQSISGLCNLLQI